MPIAKRAVLLAAGLGTRMRPLTETMPKTLLTIGGRALLDHALDRLAAHGVERVLVNAHWQADQIAAHLEARKPPPLTEFRREPVLLGGGGTVAASLREGFPGTDPFFVVNGDTVWLDGPHPALDRIERVLDDRLDAVILVHRTFQVKADTGPGDFFVDKLGIPARRREREIAPYIYAGITLARPSLFETVMGRAAPFSMNAVWDAAIEARRLLAVVHDGLWFHLSRPEDLAEAEQALAAQVTGQTT